MVCWLLNRLEKPGANEPRKGNRRACREHAHNEQDDGALEYGCTEQSTGVLLAIRRGDAVECNWALVILLINIPN